MYIFIVIHSADNLCQLLLQDKIKFILLWISVLRSFYSCMQHNMYSYDTITTIANFRVVVLTNS